MKKVFFVLLSLSFGCFAQNAASNSATTTAPQTATQSAAPAPPLVVPSNVALPGSGPPMGAPITNGNTNDSRTGGTVQVYNPATVLEHPITTASGETANTTPAPTAPHLRRNDSATAGATQQSGRVDQQKRTSSNSASADQSAANTGSSNDQASAPDDQSGSNSSRLPASGSELPLLALLGVAVASGGAIYRFRR